MKRLLLFLCVTGCTVESSSVGDGGIRPSEQCLSVHACANSAQDCSQGERCNTALDPPRCQAIFCGAEGTFCADDSRDPGNLCQSRYCDPSGLCRPLPPDMSGLPDLLSACGHPGDTGNSLGVGTYCQSKADCAAFLSFGAFCSVSESNNTSFCSIPCNPSVSGECGAGARCGSGHESLGQPYICWPTSCVR